MGINVAIMGGHVMYGATATIFATEFRVVRLHGSVDCNRFVNSILLEIGSDQMERLEIADVGMLRLVRAAQTDSFQGRMFGQLAGHFVPRAVVGLIGCFEQDSRTYLEDTRTVRDALAHSWVVANIVLQAGPHSRPRFIE